MSEIAFLGGGALGISIGLLIADRDDGDGRRRPLAVAMALVSAALAVFWAGGCRD